MDNSGTISKFTRVLGQKQYEIQDHLGNVKVVFDDYKEPVSGGSGSEKYDLNVLSLLNYYPFGMSMPGMGYEAGGSRYGFNGMEKDDVIKGVGNSYDFGGRNLYSSRLGRFGSPDPLDFKFPFFSPYAYAWNNPIFFIDSEGEVGLQSIYQTSAASSKNDIKLKAYMDEHYKLTFDKIVATAKFIAEISDINDIHIANQLIDGVEDVTTITGQPAGTVDKIMTAVPIASGGAVNKVFKGFKFKKAFLKFNFSEKISNAWANGGKLRDKLIKSGEGLKDEKWQAHHIIPRELIGENKVVNDAIEAGFDFNGINNGIALPETVHKGSHAKYTAQVREQIKKWEIQNPNHSQEEAKNFIQNLSEQLKEQINKEIKKSEKKINEAKVKN